MLKWLSYFSRHQFNLSAKTWTRMWATTRCTVLSGAIPRVQLYNCNKQDLVPYSIGSPSVSVKIRFHSRPTRYSMLSGVIPRLQIYNCNKQHCTGWLRQQIRIYFFRVFMYKLVLRGQGGPKEELKRRIEVLICSIFKIQILCSLGGQFFAWNRKIAHLLSLLNNQIQPNSYLTKLELITKVK